MKYKETYEKEIEQLIDHQLELVVDAESQPRLMLLRLKASRIILLKLIQELEREISHDNITKIECLLINLERSLEAGIMKIESNKGTK